ncbi:lysophospholipid acyltransferase family protein [Streptomyces sp. BBFR51]|uniref:lysophospholipid acyltransferase family protein n=1 Tax=Streptomyces sp. BBFR51 TaxID=3372856 RepID=UPI0037DC4C2A
MAAIARPIVLLLFRREWAGAHHFPPADGFIAAVNHNSYIDPVAYGYFQYAAGHPPRFFAKAGLFKGAFGRLMRAMKHIPVTRGGAGALEDLSRFRDREPGPEVWREATEDIMAAITSLLAEIRGLPAPATAEERRTSSGRRGTPPPSSRVPNFESEPIRRGNRSDSERRP